MSKEEFMKIQKSVLKVNIHCDGCKHKVKKILQKIEGVFTTEIDAEQGKVTVSGNVDPNVLIKKLAKSGKHAELWGAPKSNNHNNRNQNHLANQFKSMQIDNGKGDGSNKGQMGGNIQPKGGGGGGQHGGPNHQQLGSLQDLKLPQFKPPPSHNPNQNQKSLKFDMPEDDDDFSDDEFDDDDLDDGVFDDDELDEPPLPLNKMKAAMGNGAPMMLNGMNVMNPPKGGNAGPGNGKKGGGGAVPIQVHGTVGGNDGKNGGAGGNNQNQGGGNKNNGGKNGNNAGGGGGGEGNNNKNGNNEGGKKGGDGCWKNGMMEGVQAMNRGPQHMGGVGGGGSMSIPMGSMGNMLMGQMGGVPALQGLPAASMNGSPGRYFPGGGPDGTGGNPYSQQQQYLAALMNQQRAMGNERFQPLMYARPPPAVNYMYPPPAYPYGALPEPYSNSGYNYFSDENPSSCSVM